MSTASWQGTPTSSESNVGRILEVVTVLLLGLATVGSAWCAYQVSRWNAVETDEVRIAALVRLDASREFALATQKVAYDASLVAEYAGAVLDDNEELQSFLRTTLMRPDFLPILDEWQAEIAATGAAPSNLFENEDYLAPLFEKANALDEQSLEETLLADEAGQHANDYILTTLFMASALFFAGVTASFSTRSTRVILLSISAIVLGVAAARLVGLPVA